MSSDGWIKLHREIFDSDIWHDATTFRLFIYLIGQASHQDGFKYKGMTLNKGQFVRSYRKLADDLSYKEGRGYKKYSLSTIKSSIQKLISAERVNVKQTELGTLFTIVNYARYQQKDDFKNRTQNTNNDEVRTKSELSPNEPRTNPEQYQELEELKELKNDDDDTRMENDAIVFFQENFGMVTPYLAEELISWIDDLNDELLIEAMKRAIERGTKNWNYVKRILMSWRSKGIKTLEQAKAEEIEFQNQQQSRYGNKQVKQRSNEVIPDWFENREDVQQAPVSNDANTNVVEMEKILEKYRREG